MGIEAQASGFTAPGAQQFYIVSKLWPFYSAKELVIYR